MASSRQPWFDSSAMKKKEETDELLVFGYSCKLFRDDEKAQYIDQGKHLIPWMGDETLKIDRYDVRGTVYDLRSLEPLAGGASEALWTSLSDAERKVEQLCDEERYRALYHNEAEEVLYQEEELKRLQQALDPQNSYGQVAYSYDSEANGSKSDNTEKQDPSEQAEDEDEPFIPPQELDIPVGMVLPERTKLNAIIEKTALFISTQGPQMEILLKMKQANNPQFSFLSFDCPLHSYYRHLLMAIKTGRYRPKRKLGQQEQDSESSEHYLHPSLAAASSRVELAPNIPSISYKPSADCAYSMLVNKIKDKQLKLSDDNSEQSTLEGTSEIREELDSGCLNSVGENSSFPSVIPIPSGELQLIIDKMASYVIKNGRDFESVVRSKGDKRFAFLVEGHEFHPYYEHKVRVYQGLEAPLQPRPVQSADHSKVKKKIEKIKSPIKKPRPILLPGYEISDDDDSDESDDEDSQKYNGTSVSKPKLAPVSFSIKKPKETEILKEVRSALPVEEESSDDGAEADLAVVTKPNSETEAKRSISGQDQSLAKATAHILSDPGDEMVRLQQMLKEKEQQLRELEIQKKLSEKRNEDIFPIERKEKRAETVPDNEPLKDVVPSVECTVEKEHNVKCKPEIERDGEHLIESKSKELDDKTKTDEAINKKKEADVLLGGLEEEVIAEAEIIDLTDDAEDSRTTTDIMRQERKRKAAAFLNLIKKDKLCSQNVVGAAASDSDASSKRSTPSPPAHTSRFKKNEYLNYNGASIPRTSLMARLTASSALRRKPAGEKRGVEEMARDRRGSESPVKSSSERGRRSLISSSTKKHTKKRRGSSSDSEEPRSRSRSRSIPYSRSSPHKRRPVDDCDLSEHRSHRQPKDDRHKIAYRRKHSDMNDSEVPSAHSHHKRHRDSRHFRGHSQGYSKNFKETKANSSDSSE